ncbi:MAG: PfkB family carbohydrate kinase [Candidatus Gastranaerophilaceae bacterium]|jgi:ribokinase
MKKKFDVIGFGSVCVDNIVVLQEYPLLGAKVEILKSQKQVGGSISTTLKALSGFGAKTAIIGKIGDDDNGKFIKDDLFSSDISISNIICEKKSTSAYSQIWIDSKTGSKTTAYSLGTLTPIKSKDINFEKLPFVKFLHLNGENNDISIEMANFYKKMGSYISVDTGSFRKDSIDMLYFADVIIMPKSFAESLFYGDNTDSERHCHLVLKVKEYFNEAELIVITGILFGLLNNWKIEDTLEFASAATALKCMHLGNTKLPNFLEVKNFIKNSRTCKNVEILT